MSLEQELVELKAALRELIVILKREGWRFTSGWEADINEIDGILAGERSREGIMSFAKAVSSGFGVGMGSLRDVYLGDDFEAAREDVMQRLSRIVRHVRDAPGYIPRIRRHLTALEDQLLEAGMVDDATRLRGVLNSGPLDVPAARAIVEDLVARIESLPEPVVLALAPARAELSAVK